MVASDREATRGGAGHVAGRVPLVVLGSWPRVTAQILRARLETAGIDVFAEAVGASVVTLAVGTDRLAFARAVVTELDVDDEVPDTSPFAYVARIEEHLWAVGELLAELRARLEEGGGGTAP
ncbi:MAG TPA: hypothetical protein VLV81_07590 [Acidimicrobiia bacterium]|nr:hypothetical protein [Acidimicrobiia bacterium]